MPYQSALSEKHWFEKDFWAECVYDAYNERLKVEDCRGNTDSLLKKCKEEAKDHSFSKIIVKSRKEHLASLLAGGFTLEAVIPGYFNGSDAYLFTFYKKYGRYESVKWLEEDEILEQVQHLPGSFSRQALPEGYLLRKANKDDAASLAHLYRTVFKIYPTPIHDPGFIQDSIENGTIFYIVERGGIISSAASAEINASYHNAELTDCATLPEERGHGLMKILLKRLEEELQEQGIFCAYTIARSLSFGMNAAFRQLGYSYTGRLKNNCYIFDKLEDMNVWAKDFSKQR